MSTEMYDDDQGQEYPPVSHSELQDHLQSVDDDTLWFYYEDTDRDEWGETAWHSVVNEIDRRHSSEGGT